MKELLEVLNESGESTDSQDACMVRLAEALPFPTYYAVARSLWSDQAFWRFLLPKQTGRHSVAVVLESRLGSISLAMAALFDTIVIAHTNAEILELTRIRASQLAKSRFHFVQLDHRLDLPFSTGTASAVIVYDVEANILEKSIRLDAKRYRTLVREAARVVTPDGVVMIGSNNGDCYQWWKENVRRSIGLKASVQSPVPRLTASLDLLNKNMFNDGDVFMGSGPFNASTLVQPELSNWTVPYREKNGYRGYKASWREIVKKSKCMRWQCPSFLAIRERQKSIKFLEELLISDPFVRDTLGSHRGLHPIIARLISGNAGTTIALVKLPNGKTPQWVIRLPSDQESLERCETNMLALTTLRSSCLGDLIPLSLSCGTFEDQTYFIESFMPGTSINYDGPDKGKDQMIISACERHAEFQIGQARIALPAKRLAIEKLNPWITTLASSSTVNSRWTVTEVRDLFEKALEETMFPLVPSHGDWKTGNLLFDKRGHLSGIIDWECYGNDGFPCTDFLMLLIYKLAKEESSSIADVFIRNIVPWNVPEIYRKFVVRYLRMLEIDDRGFDLLRAISWLELVNNRFDKIQKASYAWKKAVWLDLWPHLQGLVINHSK